MTSLRQGPWLPFLSVAMAFTLVAGQFFTCCRINETISAGIAKYLQAFSHASSHGTDNHAAKTHPGCHGHGVKQEITAPFVPIDHSGTQLKSDEACLSEAANTPKALQSTSLELSSLFQPSPFLWLASLPFDHVQVERLAPQNKSSPPVYLLTLRLLV